jgi:hypothetical protein
VCAELVVLPTAIEQNEQGFQPHQPTGAAVSELHSSPRKRRGVRVSINRTWCPIWTSVRGVSTSKSCAAGLHDAARFHPRGRDLLAAPGVIYRQMTDKPVPRVYRLLPRARMGHSSDDPVSSGNPQVQAEWVCAVHAVRDQKLVGLALYRSRPSQPSLKRTNETKFVVGQPSGSSAPETAHTKLSTFPLYPSRRSGRSSPAGYISRVSKPFPFGARAQLWRHSLANAAGESVS